MYDASRWYAERAWTCKRLISACYVLRPAWREDRHCFNFRRLGTRVSTIVNKCYRLSQRNFGIHLGILKGGQWLNHGIRLVVQTFGQTHILSMEIHGRLFVSFAFTIVLSIIAGLNLVFIFRGAPIHPSKESQGLTSAVANAGSDRIWRGSLVVIFWELHCFPQRQAEA